MNKLFIFPGLLLLFAMLIITGCSDSEGSDEDDFSWHYIGDTDEPAFLNGWQNWENGFDVCAYGIDAGGFVHLKGVSNNPSSYDGTNQIVFVLPAGYRPEALHIYAVYSSSTDESALVYIYPNGNVTVYDTDNPGPSALVSFDGITWFSTQ